MKKLFSILFASMILFAVSCTERTCPTYSKSPVDNLGETTDKDA